MSHTTNRQHPHWWVYSLSFVAAIIIGIDCAIDSAYFMHLMGGFYAAPLTLIACCTAALIINGILYFNDLPTALDAFFGAKKNEAYQTSKLQKTLNIMKYPVSIFSGLGMGLNTYWAFISIHLAFTNPFIIACFCTAYGLGTYAIISTAFDLSYEARDTANYEKSAQQPISVTVTNLYKETVLDKFGQQTLTSKLVTTSLFIILTVANYWAVKSMSVAATSALLALLPTAGLASTACIVTFATFMLIGETIFAFKASIWLVSRYTDTAQHTNRVPLTVSHFVLYTLVGLSGIANAALTAASNAKFTAIFGFFDATVGVTKAVQETEDGMADIQNDSQHKDALNQGIKGGIIISFLLVSWWASEYFALPFIASLHFMAPSLALTTIAITIGFIAYIMNQFIFPEQVYTPKNHALKSNQLELVPCALGKQTDHLGKQKGSNAKNKINTNQTQQTGCS